MQGVAPMDAVLPGFEAGYIRLELEHSGDNGWSLAVLLADDPVFVQKSDRHQYAGLSWAELVQIVADVLDAEGPKNLPDGPF